jgi:hypothetical protein
MKHTQLLIIGLLLLSACDRRTDIPPPPPEPAPVVIYGEISDIDTPGDIHLDFWQDLVDPGIKDPGPLTLTEATVPGTPFQGVSAGLDRIFRFVIPAVSGPGYISLYDSRHRYLEQVVVEPGDSVKIRLDNRRLAVTFGGPAADKFSLQWELYREYLSASFTQPSRLLLTSLGPERQALVEEQNRTFGREIRAVYGSGAELAMISEDLDRMDADGYLAILERYRGKINPEAFRLIRADYLAKSRAVPLSSFNLAYLKASGTGGDSVFRAGLDSLFHARMSGLDPFGDNREGLERSYGYLEFLEAFKKAEANATGKNPADVLMDVAEPPLREALLVRHFLSRKNLADASPETVRAVLDAASVAPYAGMLGGILSRTRPGTPAYDFRLVDAQGYTRRLDEFRGKTVLVDFWFSGCKACVHLNETALGKIDAELSGREDFAMLSVSTDRNGEHWQRSLASGQYSPPGALHLNTGPEGTDNGLLTHYNIRLFPHVMLIDGEGRLVKSGFANPTYETLRAAIDKTLGDG